MLAVWRQELEDILLSFDDPFAKAEKHFRSSSPTKERMSIQLVDVTREMGGRYGFRFLAHALRTQENRKVIWLGRQEVFMASETEFFYLVLLTLLTLIMHLILSRKHRRDDNHPHHVA